MSEHLALEQTLRHASQIDFNERRTATRTVSVNRLRYQFFSRTAFPRYQHRSVGSGNTADYPQDVLQSFRATHYLFKPTISFHQALLLFFRATQFDSRLHCFQKRQVIPRFGYEIECTGLHALHSQLNTSPSRNQYHRHLRLEDFHLPEQHQPLFTRGRKREVHIHQYNIRRSSAHTPQRLLRTRYRFHLITGTLQQKAKRRTDGTIIINNKYSIFLFHKHDKSNH